MKSILLDIIGTILKKKPKEIDFIDISEYLQSRGYNVYYQSLEATYRYIIFVRFLKIPITSYKKLCNLIFEAMKIKVDKETLEETAKLFKKRYQLEFFKDAVDFLNNVKNKYQLALVSTIPKFMFEEFLGTKKRYFKAIITGWEAKASKPDPKIYLTAIKELGVKAEEAVYIGDKVDLDIIPPKKLGMKTIYISREGGLCPEANYSVRSLKECLKYI